MPGRNASDVESVAFRLPCARIQTMACTFSLALACGPCRVRSGCVLASFTVCGDGTPSHHDDVGSGLDIAIPHKICDSHTETLGNPMEGAESQVPFAPLNCAVIGSVHSD